MNAMLASLIPNLGWALLDFLWQGAAIGLAAALVLAALRDARPQARYAVACLALALCALLPLGNLLAGVQAQAPVAGITAPATTSTLFTATDPVSTLGIAGESWQQAWRGRLAWIVAAWSLGAGLFALRLLAGFAWVGDIRARARPVDAVWQARMQGLAGRIGLRGAVPLAVAPGLDGPVAAGWWRPVVLLPAALLAHMPVDLLEALLAHELAHIRRHDYLVNLVQGAIEALLFYHPVVWWLSRRIRIERELVADAIALRAIGDPRCLAIALQQLDRYQADRSGDHASPAPMSLLPAAHGGKLMTRIQHLLRPRLQAIDWRLLVPVAGLALACAAVYARTPAPSATPAPAARAAIAPRAFASVATPAPAVAPVAAVSASASAAATPAPDAIAAVAAVAPTPAPRPRVAWSKHDPYALVRDGEDGMMLSGDMDDVAQVKRTRQHLHGDFLWFRRGGADYVVQDPALLAQARSAWADAEAVGHQMEAISAQMKPYTDRMEGLSAQMEAYSAQAEPASARMEQASRRMEPLSRQQQALGEKMQALGEQMSQATSDAERDRLAAKMESLQAGMDPLSAQMEQASLVMQKHAEEMRAMHAPMEALGKQMEAASAPMKPLSEKLQLLGEREEGLAHKADAEVQALIERSLRDGKAEPAAALRR